MVKLYHKSLWQLYRTPLHPSRCTYRIFLLNRTHQFTYSFKIRHNCKVPMAQKGSLCCPSIYVTPKKRHPLSYGCEKKKPIDNKMFKN